MEDAFVLLLLSELPRVGERTLARLRARAEEQEGGLARIVIQPPEVLAAEYGLAPAAIHRLHENRAQHETHCRMVADWLRQAQVRITHPGHPSYPARLTPRAGAAPPLLYLRGNSGVLAGPTLAVLASREPGEQSVVATVQIAQHAAREGFALVTGGMKATHRIAAAAVRAAGARRAIVLDRGVLAAFGGSFERDPFGLAAGPTSFDARRTLVLSPFRPCDHASPRNGQRRDELIAALGDLVVATSARPGGEVERICLRALDAGQCVLSWQGENAALAAAGAAAICGPACAASCRARPCCRSGGLDLEDGDLARGKQPDALAGHAEAAVDVEVGIAAPVQSPIEGGEELGEIASAAAEPGQRELTAVARTA
jgi:predicted Rossmann fold nucleotide-binding protein DprA/Smf involved in DNA uptake